MGILIFNKLSHFDAPYEKWLQDLNEELYLLAPSKFEKDFHEGYAQTRFFDNYDFNNSVELAALELYEQYPYHTVVVTAERDIMRAAKLREVFGLQGQSWESAYAFRNKAKMKTMLREAGIRVPVFKQLETTYDLYGFIQEHGYPVVVKPVDGMGSRSTTVLENRDDLEQYLIEGLSPGMEVEEFITGEMYHVDGLILDGELVHIWPSKYLNDCLAFHDGKYLGSYLLASDNPLTERLNEYVAKLLNVLPTPRHITFHAEVFHTPQDELILCEIACRTGGSRICEEFRQAFDIDLTQCAVQAQCGLPVTLSERVREKQGPVTQYGFIGIPPREGVFINAPKADELPDWVTEYNLLGKSGYAYTGGHTSVDYVLTVLLKGESEQEVNERIVEIVNYFEQKMVWA